MITSPTNLGRTFELELQSAGNLARPRRCGLPSKFADLVEKSFSRSIEALGEFQVAGSFGCLVSKSGLVLELGPYNFRHNPTIELTQNTISRNYKCGNLE